MITNLREDLCLKLYGMDRWRVYKQSVPVFGAVILEPGLNKVLLVQSCAGEEQNLFYPR